MEKVSIRDVFTEYNLEEARMALKTNKVKTPGVDNVLRQDFFGDWDHEKAVLKEKLLSGEYEPSPLKRILIRKSSTSKEMRKISIPTVSDQVVQWCIKIELERIYMPRFHPCNYGFIKGRGTIPAIKKCLEYINDGYAIAVDIDIRHFFDTIRHYILLGILSPYLDDNVLSLIKKFIKAPAITPRRVFYNRRGVSQGGCASQLLANILLNELDWHLEEQGVKFVRYADDLVVLCRDLGEAGEVFDNVSEYLHNILKLNINYEKTKVIPVLELNYLGYTFAKSKDKYCLAVSPKKAELLLDKISKTVNKRKDTSIDWWNLQGAFNRGWLNYYRYAEFNSLREIVISADQYHESQIAERLKSDENESIYDIVGAKQYISMGQWLEELRDRGRVTHER